MIRQIKNNRKTFLIIVFNLSFIPFCSSSIFAQPAVTAVSGTLNQGASVTITGSGFGTKAAAAPLKWENFENGALGSNLSTLGWSTYNVSGSSPAPSVSDLNAYGQGTKSAIKNIRQGIEDFSGSYFTGFGGATEGYISLYFNWNTADGSSPSGGGIFKWIRFNTNQVYSGVPSFGQTYQPGWFYEYFNSGTSRNTVWNQYDAKYTPPRGNWSRMEMHWKLSNPGGTSNGMAETWVNFAKNMNQVNVVTRQSGDNSTIYSVLLPQMCSGAGENYRIFVDDVYIDNTIARVEIGDASTWGACTKRELQIPTAWSDRSISVKVNQGALGNLQTAYLYVVDANGNVNSNGYPLSLQASAPTVPNPPLNLVVK